MFSGHVIVPTDQMASVKPKRTVAISFRRSLRKFTLCNHGGGVRENQLVLLRFLLNNITSVLEAEQEQQKVKIQFTFIPN